MSRSTDLPPASSRHAPRSPGTRTRLARGLVRAPIRPPGTRMERNTNPRTKNHCRAPMDPRARRPTQGGGGGIQYHITKFSTCVCVEPTACTDLHFLTSVGCRTVHYFLASPLRALAGSGARRRACICARLRGRHDRVVLADLGELPGVLQAGGEEPLIDLQNAQHDGRNTTGATL